MYQFLNIFNIWILDFPVVRITPIIRTTIVPISGVIGTTVVRIASAFHDSKHNHQQRVLFQTQCLLRCHLYTRKTARGQERCPEEHLWSPIRFNTINHYPLLSSLVWRVSRQNEFLITDLSF